MPKTIKTILTSEELKFLRKLFKKVLIDRIIKKTSFIPEKFNAKFPHRKLSFKVLERCYNQDENIYSESDIDSNSDSDFSMVNASEVNSVNSSIRSSVNLLDQDEENYFAELLKIQKDQNVKINNHRGNPKYYTDLKVYENFIKKYPLRAGTSFKILKNLFSNMSVIRMQTIQPSRRHSYSDEENRAILDAYRNSFLIDHEQNLNLILALSRNNF
jgi:hypothetical protein